MTQDLFAGRLNAQRVGVLDGGFATFMEDALGLEMPSPLWSATLLDPQHRQGTWQGHDAVRAAHKAFIQSGSRVVETASYQASVPSFARSQPPNPTYAPAVAEGLMRASIRLAVEAADAAHQEGGPNAMVAISLGPYGAMLEGGREYTGEYGDAGQEDNPEVQAQVRGKVHEFHLGRLAALSADTKLWARVGLLAFETIPRLDEAEEIVKVLAELDERLQSARKEHMGHGHQDVDVYLPYPPTGPRATPRTIIQALRPKAGDAAWPLVGFGVNCTKPHFIQSIVRDFVTGLDARETTWATISGKPALFVYPDGGLTWDGKARVWRSDVAGEHKSAAPHTGDHEGHSEEKAWAKDLISAVVHNPAVQAGRVAGTAPFDSLWLGGCCKSGCGHISELAKLVYL